MSSDTKAEDYARRLDIRFITVMNNTEKVTLIFECKKISTPVHSEAARNRKSYLDQGISRFVKESYAPTEPLGFLIAFIENKACIAMVLLKQALGKSRVQAVLNMSKHTNDEFVAEPPARLEKHSLFSTERIRQIKTALQLTDTIALYRIPLGF